MKTTHTDKHICAEACKIGIVKSVISYGNHCWKVGLLLCLLQYVSSIEFTKKSLLLNQCILSNSEDFTLPQEDTFSLCPLPIHYSLIKEYLLISMCLALRSAFVSY